MESSSTSADGTSPSSPPQPQHSSAQQPITPLSPSLATAFTQTNTNPLFITKSTTTATTTNPLATGIMPQPPLTPSKPKPKKVPATSSPVAKRNPTNLDPDDKDPTRQGKGKDLSHVPCRFFKMGVCTAGDGCVFSHDAADVGTAGKQVCQWFLKGNCRFGHKCALAHVYPNEPPTMDRKHKKAAQLAANGVPQEEIDAVVYGGTSYILPAGGYQQGEDPNHTNGDERAPEEASEIVKIADHGGKRSYSQTLKTATAGKTVTTNTTDGSGSRMRRGSSVDTRTGAVAINKKNLLLNGKESDVPLIGSISPANRHQAALLSTLNRPGSAGMGSSPTPTTATFIMNASATGSSPSTRGFIARGPGDESENFKSRPVPLSVPGPLPMSARSGSFVQDPIGTPPRESALFSGSSYSASQGGPKYLSPADATSQTVRPGMKTTGFSDPSLSVPSNGPRFSSSVGAGEFGQMGRDIWGQRTSTGPITRTNSTQSAVRPSLDMSLRRESDVFLLDDVDDAGEEMIPGSLTELLTPRERARRLSRRESGSAPGVASGAVGIRAGWVSSSGSGVETTGLGGIGSSGNSWDSRPNMDALLHRQAMSAGAVDGGFLRSLWDDAGEDARRTGRRDNTLSPPATASSAVGGLSSMFAGNGMNDGSLTAPPDTGFQLGPSNSSVAFLPSFTVHRSTMLGDHSSSLTRGNLHSPSRPSPLHRDTTTQAISSSNVPVKDGQETHPVAHHLRPILSPGTRALETHAPGQSLPQGLAAGLSRLHVRPSNARQHSAVGNGLGVSGMIGGEALSPSGSSMGNQGVSVNRYETLARPGPAVSTEKASAGIGSGEGEDDDLFEMEG